MKVPTSQVEGNWLVIPDLHIRKKPGGEDRRSIDAVLKYASDHKWNGLIFLGDVLDCNTVNSHEIGNIRATAGETIFKDFERANEVLDDFHQATHPDQAYVIGGNHEWRLNRMIDSLPQLEGLIEPEIGLKLAERGYIWVPYWNKGTLLHVGKASFGHGRYTPEHHAKKHAMAHGRNFYYGHLHDCQEHTMEREGDDDKYEAASLGCLCDYRQYYLKGRPTRWQQAAGVFRFQKNGFFNRYTVKLFDHKFLSPEGKLYRG